MKSLNLPSEARHRRLIHSIGWALLALLQTASVHGEDAAVGSLVIVGGGGTPAEVVRRMIEMAGGNDAQVVILPQASSSDGAAAAEMIRSAGAENVAIVDVADRPSAIAKLEPAELIWFPGGSQTRLVESLRQADLVELIRRRYREGSIIGGTSAGAAAMSEIMIPKSPQKQALITGNTPIIPGLGLAPQLIVDQHFIVRNRMNRLLSAVIDHPGRIGVGIGERTAILWHNQQFEVLGEGSVVVIDARDGEITAPPSKRQSASNLRLHVLRAGETYRL